jgi:predicted RNA-binding protein with PUA-like domain
MNELGWRARAACGLDRCGYSRGPPPCASHNAHEGQNETMGRHWRGESSSMLSAPMTRHHFLIKSEPDKYSFANLVRDGKTRWDGVRNFEARNNLRSMKKGDLCLFYHSNEGKAVVGIARVTRAAYADPTTEDDWSAVDIEPVRSLSRPVALSDMRARPELGQMMIFRRQRLSVVPVTKDEFELVVEMGKKAAKGDKPDYRAD